MIKTILYALISISLFGAFVPVYADEIFDFHYAGMQKNPAEIGELLAALKDKALDKTNFDESTFFKYISAGFLLKNFISTKEIGDEHLKSAIDFYLSDIGSEERLKAFVQQFTSNLEAQFKALRERLVEESLNQEKTQGEREAAAQRALEIGKVSVQNIESLKADLEAIISFASIRQFIKTRGPTKSGFEKLLQ